MQRRVVVTGIGVVSSAGIGKEKFWDGLTSGTSFIRRIQRFDPTGMKVQIASEIEDKDLLPYVPREPARIDSSEMAAAFAAGRGDSGLVTYAQHEGTLSLLNKRYTQGPQVENRAALFGMIVAQQAMEDSQILAETIPRNRRGVVVGTTLGPSVEAIRLLFQGHKFGNWADVFPAGIGRAISRRYHLQGFCQTISSGCSAGTDAIGMAMESIQWNHSDMMLVVGTDACIDPFVIQSFDNIGALSHCNHDPEHASRPFDKDRDGFVMSEGAAGLVLEEMGHALLREAPIYGEIKGYATTTDAYHMVAPLDSHEVAAIAVGQALHLANLQPEDVSYVSAHAASTPVGDAAETRLIKNTFGKHAYKIPVSSTKSITGHQVGSAGSIQAVANLLMLERQTLIPTLNIEASDPECDLDYVPDRPRAASVETILQHTFAFSGKNSALVFSKMS
jgi:3-oxoacyl-[acyl-carrier-protein] synthase II